MAFGARYIFPNDANPRVAVGVNLPFSGNSVFTPNFTTKEAVKYNLINFFLTNAGERPLNPTFGANLRTRIFEQLDDTTYNGLVDVIGSYISNYFPNVRLFDLAVNGDPDTNTMVATLTYDILDLGTTDTIQLEFL
jgi:phage baseplate assembly protein W